MLREFPTAELALESETTKSLEGFGFDDSTRMKLK